jgi:hypothetical protein
MRIWRWVIVREERLWRALRLVEDALGDWECYREGIPECQDEEWLIDSLVFSLSRVSEWLREWLG